MTVHAVGAAREPGVSRLRSGGQLDTLGGVGPSTAQTNRDLREAPGGCGSVQELGRAPGIGEKRVAALPEKVGV